jgi:hemerythrin-like domain-containing protein
MKTTDQLSQDHREILRALEILKSASAAWRQDPLRTDEDCRTLLDFLKTFADRCHHGKEEKVLFPKLMQAGIPMNGGPLGVMLYEHDQARQLVRSRHSRIDILPILHYTQIVTLNFSRTTSRKKTTFCLRRQKTF